MVATPTDHEREMAAVRESIARQQLAALVGAVAACGGGATAYAIWVERDRLNLEPDRETYCSRRNGRGWEPAAPNDLERTPEGLFRWAVYFHHLGSPSSIPKPKTAEQLAAARERREHKRIEALADDMPLLAGPIRTGELRFKTKNALRNERTRKR